MTDMTLNANGEYEFTTDTTPETTQQNMDGMTQTFELKQKEI